MAKVKLLICFMLMLLLPLQSLAAGCQLACFMQQHAAENMHDAQPCHDQSMMPDADAQKDSEKHHTCKAQCLSQCTQANMTAITASGNVKAGEVVLNDYPPLLVLYVSVTLPNFQRPPIHLS